MSRVLAKRKKSIFAFNSISPDIDEDELEEVKKLYRSYHKLWWCFKQLHAKEKRLDLAEKVASSDLVAGGVVAGAATLNPVVLGVISGLGLKKGKKDRESKVCLHGLRKNFNNFKVCFARRPFRSGKILD